jgi:RNase H-like domain found in reverse transcriptase
LKCSAFSPNSAFGNAEFENTVSAKQSITEQGGNVVKSNKHVDRSRVFAQIGFIKNTKLGDSPMLYFIDNNAPIYLMTYASDYGIGGYLYQVINDTKQLIAFDSNSLTQTQLTWSTIQKEAYAIFFCCAHLDNLLRDRKFTILTDHKNLTFIKQASNPMIVPWHLALRELDFQILFVPGVDNSIADAMSRLCINNKPEVPTVILAANNGPYVINNDNYKIIESVHNAMVGHGGVERTLCKLQDLKLTWKNAT